MGLNAITADDVRRWRARYFTRDNAVLWVAGADIPAGLRLPLPPGAREPVPAASSALPETPAYFPGSADAVAWDSVVPRGTAAAIFAGVLERIMDRVLRTDSGLSYTVRTDYRSRGDGAAVITALADALPANQSGVLGRLTGILRGVRLGRIDPADVAAVVARHTEALQHADFDAARLPGYARDLLTGQPLFSAADLAAELTAVTVADVAAAGQAAEGAGLLMAPPHATAGPPGYPAAPTFSATTVPGAAYGALAGHAETIVAGPQGISSVRRRGPLTVRFDAGAAVLSWPDGARVFVGLDGTAVTLEPTLYLRGADAVRVLDQHAPPHLRVPMPARDPEAIPRPTRARLTRQGRRRLAVLMFWNALTLFFIGSGIVGLVDESRPHHVASGITALLVAAVFGYLSVRDLRNLRDG